MELLKELCSIQATSGNESAMTRFLIRYINDHQSAWANQPEIFHGDDFQDCLVLVWGEPKVAVFAHIDNIGFTVRYKNQLVKIGGPHLESGTLLRGRDSQGPVECEVVIDDEQRIMYRSARQIERGTDLSYVPDWRETDEFVQCCYMDNRLGVWNALKQCETIENGAIVFSCREEHGGGSVPYLVKFLHERYQIRQALISDITWVTEGVQAGNGVVISLRDTGIPRKKFLDKIIALAMESKIPFQLEVEGSGGSDGTEIQKQPYPIDWCFIGAAEKNVHSPDELVHKRDIQAMTDLYRYLLARI